MAKRIPTKRSTEPEKKTLFERAKSWAVGLTGVLVVLPALVNSGFDVYASIAKLPKTETEKINAEMFKKYFNKQPYNAFPVPVKRDAALVDAKFSIYDGGDVYVEFGNSSQWFPFPKLEKVSHGEPFSLIRSANAALAGQEGVGQFQQSDRVQGDQIIRERRWENGVLETFELDPRTGRILDRKTQLLPPSINQQPVPNTNAAQNDWLTRVDQEKIGAVTLQRFRDPVYILVVPVGWRSSSPEVRLPSVAVPRGFVTDLKSLPKAFWSLVPPDGAYAYAAVIHDYLYWTQSTDRETADKILRECLLELGLVKSTVALIYHSTRSFGQALWSANAELKKVGERRVITTFPDNPSVTWEDWKKRPEVFQ